LKELNSNSDKELGAGSEVNTGPPAKKLSAWQTYVFLMKAYCGVSLLFFPKAFQNGGYLFSGLMETASAFLTTVCVMKLVKCGLHYGVFSYSGVVERTFGRRARNLVDVFIAATQFSFTVSQAIFIIDSFSNTYN